MGWSIYQEVVTNCKIKAKELATGHGPNPPSSRDITMHTRFDYAHPVSYIICCQYYYYVVIGK